MKKFLSILLALAVGFTFTFGSAMSAFAATEYSFDDYNSTLQAEKAAQLGYVASAKSQAVGSYTYDKDGFTTITGGGTKYMKAALDAAADEVIKEITVEMDKAINNALNGTFPTATAPDKTIVSGCTTVSGKDATTMSGMKTLLEAKTDVLNKTQASLTKAFVEASLTYDASKYNAEKKAYDIDATNNVKAGNTLTAVQTMEAVVSAAKAKVAEADKEATDSAKIAGYEAAKTYFDTETAKVKTLEQEAIENGQTAITVEAAAKQFVSEALNGTNKIYPVVDVAAGTFPMDFTTAITASYNGFYEAATATAKATLFGVEVGNIKAVTKAEAMAINTAAYNAIVASEAVLKGSGMTADEIKASYADAGKIKTTLAKTMTVAEKYAEVVALGEKYKGTYESGVKIYDDAKVDKAVADAKNAVYKDLGARTAVEYLTEAANGDLDNLKLANSDLQKLNKAIQDAAKKMYVNGTAGGAATTSVKYGDNKTADADYVYLQETYDNVTEWDNVATKVIASLKDAQSYDEINKIMDDAAVKFGKLLKKADATAVKAARTSYKGALEKYAEAQWSLLSAADKAKYTVTSPATIGDVFNNALDAGKDLIDEEITIDGVKDAYVKAQALFSNLKTDDELKAMKEALEAKANALPYDSKLTITDKATVMGVYNDYVALKDAGGESTIAKTIVQTKLNKINTLEIAEISETAKTLKAKLDKVNTGSDADLEATIALKGEVEALITKGKTLEKEVTDLNKDAYVVLTAVTLGADYTAIKAIDFNAKEVNYAKALLAKAAKENATVEDKQKALDFYKGLTEKQQYTVNEEYLDTVKAIENEIKLSDAEAKAYVQDLAVTVRTAKVGKKVKVTVNADVQKLVDNGFTVEYKFYKSTKKSSGYKNTVNKTTNTYTNTNPVKGKNYYKVKLVVKNAEGTVVATTPLTQCKYGVRTIK